MNRDEAEKLWTRLLAGETLRADEERDLLAALESEEALRRELLEDTDLDGLLRGWGRGRRGEESFLRSLSCRLEATRQESRFLRRLENRLGQERPKRTRRWLFRRAAGPPAWGPGVAAAAALIFALLVALALSSSGKKNGFRKPHAPVEETPVAEAPAPEPARPRPRLAPAERRRMEEDLEALRRQEEEAARERDRALGEELRRKAEEAFRKVRESRERAEKELAEARAREKAEAERAPAPPERPATRVAVARLERAEGEVLVVGPGGGKAAARGGEDLLAGQGVVTSGGRAVLSFSDGTRLDVGGDTELADFKAEGGKRVTVVRGDVRAEVARQPKDQPMVLASAHGEATVVGTTLRLLVDLDPRKGTRLEVLEGRVRLKRASDGRSVEVSSGHFAVAATGVSLALRPLPIDEILLLPAQGRRVGAEWKLVKDDKAASGEALECRFPSEPQTTPKDPAADLRTWNREYVEFSFQADAHKDYTVWVRGAFVGDASPGWYDQMSLEAPTGALTGTPWTDAAGVASYMVNGHAGKAGYWWIGGNADTTPAAVRGDAVPMTVRFPRAGLQVLRLRAWHRPVMVRVDAIWLSATQKARPEDGQHGPASRR